MPKKFSLSEKCQIVSLYISGVSVKEICSRMNVSRNTVYLYIKKYTSFCINHGKKIPGHQILTMEQQNQHLLELVEISKICECGAAAPRKEKLIAVEKLEGQFSLRSICEYLKLPRGTYYNYKRSKTVKKAEDYKDEEFKPLVKELFYRSGEHFGAPSIRQKLKQQGYQISVKRIRRLMNEMELVPFRNREVRFFYNPGSFWHKNLLKRNFKQTEPNKVWVSDFTYIFVGGVQYYFCAVMDLFSRKIVGYTLTDKCDAEMVCQTAEKAYISRNKPEGLMFHSDLGFQYTAHKFFSLLKSKDIKQSFSRPGTPLDNAVAESFFSTYKSEDLNHREYKTGEELSKAIDEYISFYNDFRPHKAIGYLSPTEFEERYYSNLNQA